MTNKSQRKHSHILTQAAQIITRGAGRELRISEILDRWVGRNKPSARQLAAWMAVSPMFETRRIVGHWGARYNIWWLAE